MYNLENYRAVQVGKKERRKKASILVRTLLLTHPKNYFSMQYDSRSFPRCGNHPQSNQVNVGRSVYLPQILSPSCTANEVPRLRMRLLRY
jgi:hypothetical protein